MEACRFCLTRKDVAKLIFEYVRFNNLPHHNSWDNNNRASRDRTDGFLACHSTMLSLHKPKGLSIATAIHMNRPTIDCYFDLLTQTLTKYQIMRPDQIYNTDETGLS